LLGAASARSSAAPASLALPSVQGWQGPLSLNSYWQPRFANHDRSALATYRRANGDVQAYVVEYDEQRQGKEMVGYGNALTHGLDGQVVEDGVVAVAGGNARRLRVEGASGPAVLLYYYQVGTHRRTGGLASQLTYGFTSLFSVPKSSLVSVRARCVSGCDVAETQARHLLDAITQARAGRDT
jgi:EpsI family protein